MIGFQCSATVQPVFGRSPLYTSSPQQTSSGYQSRSSSLSSPNLLDYFPAIANDGLRLSWAHGVNSRSLLNQALMGKKMCFHFSQATTKETQKINIYHIHKNNGQKLISMKANRIKS